MRRGKASKKAFHDSTSTFPHRHESGNDDGEASGVVSDYSRGLYSLLNV